MAVPRNRLSNARKNSRRAHDAKKPKSIPTCDNCKSPRLPHTICQACGAYGERVVLANRQA
jgi:large subunit ribosomal protein L32